MSQLTIVESGFI